MKEVYSGKVIFFNATKGFGFIEWTKDRVKQKDLFVHFSDIVCEGFKTIHKDEMVKFSLGENMRGEPKAIEVITVK